ncbi:Hypothetical protein, conserved [Brucella abortus str. 2308 A]|nr:hypothetical protein BMNI_I1228 [Brucella melitensis NI]EEP63191.1 Hypothetical protein, conserved [Brucella abortus str. 2308 A]EPZ75335.1 hypothetical protein M798_13565 [Brucella melitensis ADMAS-G1]ERM05491.1 hypothetical protein P408_07575 [Brucella abortus S99]ERM87522.1 hypothetical protein P865_02920 [Brucella abortus 82]EXU82502.1 hypothetical protein AX23_12720 [Brucella melitensis 548]
MAPFAIQRNIGVFAAAQECSLPQDAMKNGAIKTRKG